MIELVLTFTLIQITAITAIVMKHKWSFNER